MSGDNEALRESALRDLNLWATDMQSDPQTYEGRILALLEPLLVRQGYRVVRSPRQGNHELDLLAERDSDRVAIDIKRVRAGESYREDVVDRSAAQLARFEGLTRGLIVANAGFVPETLAKLRERYGAMIEVFDPQRLRQWIEQSYGPAEDVGDLVVEAVRRLSGELTRLIAKNVEALMEIEWRDLERVVAEVFDGLGFEVELTPPSKDGGKDVIVKGVVKGKTATYYIEVKHWRCGNAVGMEAVKSFINVIASKNVDGGLFLSTSGYTNEVESCTEIRDKRVSIGGRTKVHTLCKTYESRGTGLLCPTVDLELLVTDVD